MHWRLDAIGVTAETVRSALEKENPFLKPNGPPDDRWLDKVTEEQKAHVKAAIEAACAVVAEEQRQRLQKIVDMATAATSKVLSPAMMYNVSVAGHDETHVPGVALRFSVSIDAIVPIPEHLKEVPKPDKLLLSDNNAEYVPGPVAPDHLDPTGRRAT